MLSQRSTRFMANSFDTRYKWQLNYGNKQFFMDETHHCLVLTDNFSIKFNWVHINWEFAVFCQMNTKQSEWIYYFLLLISFCWSHHQPKNMTITFSLSLTHAARTINSSGHSHSMNTCFEVIRCIYSGAFFPTRLFYLSWIQNIFIIWCVVFCFKLIRFYFRWFLSCLLISSES